MLLSEGFHRGIRKGRGVVWYPRDGWTARSGECIAGTSVEVSPVAGQRPLRHDELIILANWLGIDIAPCARPCCVLMGSDINGVRRES